MSWQTKDIFNSSIDLRGSDVAVIDQMKKEQYQADMVGLRYDIATGVLVAPIAYTAATMRKLFGDKPEPRFQRTEDNFAIYLGQKYDEVKSHIDRLPDHTKKIKDGTGSVYLVRGSTMGFPDIAFGFYKGVLTCISYTPRWICTDGKCQIGTGLP